MVCSCIDVLGVANYVNLYLSVDHLRMTEDGETDFSVAEL